MLHTRLWMGTLLVVLTAGMLFVDRWLSPWFPFLFLVVVGLALAACIELLRLIDPGYRPHDILCLGSIAVLLTWVWLRHVGRAVVSHVGTAELPAILGFDPWPNVLWTFAVGVAAFFFVEMWFYHGPGSVVPRVALSVLVLVYLGLLPSFLMHLRWLKIGGPESDVDFGAMAVALTIFVPKSCDIGAYLTGRAIGKHRMTPVLSPKKTWEGAAGGLIMAVGVSIGLDQLGPAAPLGREWTREIAFGLVLGVAGMFGDLTESLIKRDSGQKDASQAVPGFGGVLDVVDSLIFAGPVAYLWFSV